MIYEFVDKILGYAPDKSSGEREQEEEIYLKFIGKTDIPQYQPTPKELAKLEKDRQRRDRYRERYQEKKRRKELQSATA